jgi:hypothetical protein
MALQRPLLVCFMLAVSSLGPAVFRSGDGGLEEFLVHTESPYRVI